MLKKKKKASLTKVKYSCMFTNVAILWRQKSVSSESERRLHNVLFIFGVNGFR